MQQVQKEVRVEEEEEDVVVKGEEDTMEEGATMRAKETTGKTTTKRHSTKTNKTSLCHTTQLPFRKTLLTSCHHSQILKYESSRPHYSQSIKKGFKATANGMVSTNELHDTLFLQHTGFSKAKLLKTSRAAGVSTWDKILRTTQGREVRSRQKA